MIIEVLQQVTRRAFSFYRKIIIRAKVARRYSESRVDWKSFDFLVFRDQVLRFLRTLEISPGPPRYRYSLACRQETLYASAYACMTRNMLGDLENLTLFEKAEWINYFDSFQNEEDGLFYDPVVRNDIYDDSDWWGARHLALHMIAAYTALDARPKHQFAFLKSYYSKSSISSWLDAYDWNSKELGLADPDNKIMNIGCLLQYQRDAWGDESAGMAVQYLKDYLLCKVNPKTGMWGGFDPDDPKSRSRMVQFAYHLFPIFFYDGEFPFDAEKIVRITLATQNKLGGFGISLNSSACEDIDSIDILIRCHSYASTDLQSRITSSLTKAFSWVIVNQVEDGGFVFRLNETFRYGSEETSSDADQGAALPTWFRILSIAYMARFFGLKNNFYLINRPGYEL